MCKNMMPPRSTAEPTEIVDQITLDALRCSGYVVVPLRPTQEMIQIGAPFCFIVPADTMKAALIDAEDCYRAMIELGCL